MAKEQRIPKSMLPERLKLLYTNIPDDGLLAWATLKKLGFSNQIGTLLNNGIIKREERGRYTLLKTTDILKLLTDGESVFGAVKNCLKSQSCDDLLYKQIILQYICSSNFEKGYKCFVMYLNKKYEEGILISNRGTEEYFFIIITLLLFKIILGDNKSLVSDEEYEIVCQFEDNYKLDSFKNRDILLFINNIEQKRYINAYNMLTELFNNDFPTNLSIIGRLLIHIMNLNIKERKKEESVFYSELEPLIRDSKWNEIIQLINNYKGHLHSYIKAIKYVAEIMVGENVKSIKSDGDNDITKFLYNNLFHVSQSFLKRHAHIQAAGLLIQALEKKSMQKEEEVDLDSIARIISLYNSLSTCEFNIIEGLEFYFAKYFKNDPDKIRLAKLIFLLEQAFDSFSLHDYLFALYSLKIGKYDLIYGKYQNMLQSCDDKKNYIKEILSYIIRLSFLHINESKSQKQDDDLQKNIDTIIWIYAKQLLRAKTLGILYKTILKFHITPTTINSFADIDINEFIESKKPFKVIGPIKKRLAHTLLTDMNVNGLLVDRVNFCKQSYILLRNSGLDISECGIDDQKVKDSLMAVLSCKKPDKNYLDTLLSYYISISDYENIVACHFCQDAVIPGNISDNKSLFLALEMLDKSCDEVEEHIESEDIIYYIPQGPLEIIGPLNHFAKVYFPSDCEEYNGTKTKEEIFTDEITINNNRFLIVRNPRKASETELIQYIPANNQDNSSLFLNNLQIFVRCKNFNKQNLLFLAKRYESLQEESVAVVFYKLYVDLLNKRGDKIPSIILQNIQAMQNNNKLMLSKHIPSS